MGKHDDANAAGTDAQRKAAQEAERKAVELRNLREQLRRQGKVRGDGHDR